MKQVLLRSIHLVTEVSRQISCDVVNCEGNICIYLRSYYIQPKGLFQQ